jgi:hypothetical protein
MGVAIALFVIESVVVIVYGIFTVFEFIKGRDE